MSFTAKTDLPKQYETYDFIVPSQFTGKLTGKVAVVTGASAGLGRAACCAFAAAGASVACVARRQIELETFVSELKTQHGVPATAVVADVSDPANAKKIAEQVQRVLGPVDILLNCAGVTRLGTLAAEEDFATWWRVVEVNLRGPVALIHAILPSMIERKTGIAMTVSSTSGSMDVPLNIAYATSKAAVIKFQQDLAVEVERHGIMSFSIHPGSIHTELGATDSAVNQKSIQDELLAQKMFEEFQNMKYQSPDLLGDTCVALCADERCRVLNGKYIDCEQPLDEVLKEAEKPQGGRIGRDHLYHLRLDEL